MPSSRRVRVVFTGVTPAAEFDPRQADALGVVLHFRPERRRADIERIDHPAVLGPEFDVPAVEGLGRVARILRAARIALPGDLEDWVGRDAELIALLERAVGTSLFVELRPRSRLRFTAWTDAGVETVDDVTDVVESPDAYLVLRKNGRYPVRVPREAVVRKLTECERWYEVTEIDRA